MSEPPQQQPRRQDQPPSGEPPRAEAEIATPPRGIPVTSPATEPSAEAGIPPVAGPAAVWGAGRTSAPSAQRSSASRTRVLQIVALVVGLVGTGWISTEQFRTAWTDTIAVEPAGVDQAGVATLDGLTVSLVEATDLGETPSLPGTDWQPPAGFHAWRVVLDTESTNEELFACDVALVDGDREFLANYFVDSFVDGYEWTYTCAPPAPDDDVPAQQALLVLVPADAQPATVEITSTAFSSGYIELEID